MKIGTGWLGWTEAQVLDTSLDVIMDAYSARLDMLRFASGRPPPSQTALPGGKMTTETFLAMFGK
jgi:hypothetical protein